MSQNHQLQKHITELKAQGSQRAESLSHEWQNTVQELKDALRLAQDQVQQRDRMFENVEQEFRLKIEKATQGQEDAEELLTRLEAQKKEISLLSQQVREKDAKLKMQIAKNQELLGELQELSEAVHALKTDKHFAHSADLLEEREADVKEFSEFVCGSLRQALQALVTAAQSTVEASQIKKKMEPFGQKAWSAGQNVIEECQNASRALHALKSLGHDDA